MNRGDYRDMQHTAGLPLVGGDESVEQMGKSQIGASALRRKG